ncbi:MAG: aminomethyl transferase family protein [Gemmatimonadetes bacterium]|nr:aminomethyl transferase family protein [Gemmatimonadota bacterium]
MLKHTPLHPRVAALCQGENWRRWAGHIVASSYDLVHEREYHAIRNGAALLDISPLYKYLVTGRDAARLLHRVVTRDVLGMAVGQVAYTSWCDSLGKVIDDGTIARLGEDRFRLTSADPSYRWLHENAVGMQVAIDDASDATAALALQGPNSRKVLEHAAQLDLSGLRYFRCTAAAIRGVQVTISRTGYTGDLGYELWVDAEHALGVWDTLVECGVGYGLAPTGMLALDMARIEAGLMLADVDYVSAHKALIPSQTSSPYELGLDRTVKLDKDFFVGRAALEAEHNRGIAWRFVGIEIAWEPLERLYAEVGLPPRLPMVAWRTSVPLYDGENQVGYATSGCWSPLLKRYIALAHLPAAHAGPGTALEMEVTVEHRRKRSPARVVPTPFFNPPRKTR